MFLKLKILVAFAVLSCYFNKSFATLVGNVSNSTTVNPTISKSSVASQNTTGIGLDVSTGYVFNIFEFGESSKSNTTKSIFVMPNVFTFGSTSDIQYGFGAGLNAGYRFGKIATYLSADYQNASYKTDVASDGKKVHYSGSKMVPGFGFGFMYFGKHNLYYSLNFKTIQIKEKNLDLKNNNISIGIGYNLGE